ncbi:hypothetical protein PAECIP111893_05331 [Paenibacillus plantiphilus]|uniref:DUF927 domain-containing protein n=1 Tax=Paenibacillus plantiphilus TaxID=2905650 RepID=A0ABM9CXW3_9BACL|nr:DUF927 domain-containing protein [Paenibacillus plantiphilus]CAH1226213.1 hypothetical protein PAECIP111893_05331 [Paenibacillus plantiphilus]
MSVEDILNEPIELEPVDFLSVEGLQQQLCKYSLEQLVTEEQRITREIYCADSIAQISRLLDVYADERIKQGLLKPSDKLTFKKDKLEQYEHPKKKLYDSPKYVSAFELVDCPAPHDLLIPPGYELSQQHGIYAVKFKEGFPMHQLVYPAVVLPYQLVDDSNDTGTDKLVMLIKWNEQKKKWQKHPYPVALGKLTAERNIGTLDGAGVIVLGDLYRKSVAEFMTMLINHNDGLSDLPITEAVSRCGWTEEGLFFPFTTKDKGDNLVFTGHRGTTIHSIKKQAKHLPKGAQEAAFQLIQELKDNPVFAVMLAGCLASPLVPKLEGILDENIGIDLFGETTTGKTAMQVLVISLVYGLGKSVKSTWSKARLAGIWKKVGALNHLPVILDDSHGISDELSGVPHHLLNGKEGDKSIKTSNGDWDSNDSTVDRYRGTIFFNGEISIAAKAPHDSAGIHGRLFKVNHPPFPAHYSETDVEDLKARAEVNGGHFAEDWIRHIAKLDVTQIQQRLRELASHFRTEGSDKLYGRLTTKATILIYCLEQFNQLFGTSVNINAAVSLLKTSMKAGTKRVSVADGIMERIIEKVWEKIGQREPNGKGCILLNFKKPDPFDLLDGVDVCYKKGEALIITNSVLEEVLKGTEHKKSIPARQLLVTAKYLETSDLDNHRYPSVDEHKRRRIYGMLFKFDAIKHLLPDGEREETEQTQIAEMKPLVLTGLPERD